MIKKRLEMLNKFLLLTEKEIDIVKKEEREELFSLLIIRQDLLSQIKEIEEKTKNGDIPNKKQDK